MHSVQDQNLSYLYQTTFFLKISQLTLTCIGFESDHRVRGYLLAAIKFLYLKVLQILFLLSEIVLDCKHSSKLAITHAKKPKKPTIKPPTKESLLYTTFYPHNKDHNHRYRGCHTFHTLFPTHLEISMNNMLLMAILHCRYYLDRKQAQLYKWHFKETWVLIKKFNIYY